MRFNNTKIIYSALYLVSLLLTACGGSGGGGGNASYSVGGSVSGLAGYVVLQNSGNENTTVSTNGNMTFATSVTKGSTYDITVHTHPSGQICTVKNGRGIISDDVKDVSVICKDDSYAVSGSVTGLAGTLVLQDNGGDDLTVVANGTFTFATPVTDDNTYHVTVLTQPPGQICSVSTGTGKISEHKVAKVTVVCSTNTYTVSGTVSGLTGSMVLQDNNGDNLTVSASGVFTFTTPVANGSSYSVTVLTQPTGQSCSVASGTGTISVANVTNVSITCAINTYTIGGTVTGLNGSMVLQDDGTDNLTVEVNGTFTFPTVVANGNFYDVTVLNQPVGQTCTVTDGSGKVAANVTTVAVDCVQYTAPHFAYVANTNSNDISAYSINASTGALTSIGANVAAGILPHSVTTDPSGKFAYVANGGYSNVSGSSNVSAYSINASTGALTSIGTVATGTNPQSITVDPSGKFAYVANQDSNDISAYSINASTGALTSVGATVAAGSYPHSVIVDPSDRFVYVVNVGSGISAYTIDASTGALTSIGATVMAGINPWFITVDPTGKFAYVANSSSNDITTYTINATTGELISAIGTVAAGMQPISIAVDPSGKFAYVVNGSSNDVWSYTINASTGALTRVGTIATDIFPVSVTVDSSGQFVYVANWGTNNISAYSINASTGVLTSVGTVTAGTSPYSVITTGTIQ